VLLHRPDTGRRGGVQRQKVGWKILGPTGKRRACEQIRLMVILYIYNTQNTEGQSQGLWSNANFAILVLIIL
jgi:hypothetical protein